MVWHHQDGNGTQVISRFLRRPQQAQPESTTDSRDSDQNKREVSEIILFESRERRKGTGVPAGALQEAVDPDIRMDARVLVDLRLPTRPSNILIRGSA